MRKNILAKRILCALALGGIACGAFATAYAEDITISDQNDVANIENDYFHISDRRIYPHDSLSNNTLTFKNTLDFTTTNGPSPGNISVYGGYTESTSEVSGNTVNFTDGNFTNLAGIYGGYSKDGDTTSNNVVIDSSTITDTSSINGGWSTNGNASNNNTITIQNKSDVTISNIYGGATVNNENASAAKNKITISDSEVNIANSMYGGSSTHGSAHDNTIEITGSTVSLNYNNSPRSYGIYGGFNGTYSYSDVTKNHVTITGSTITADIYGGFLFDYVNISKSASVNNNKIDIDSSTITGNLYANYNCGNGASANGSITINNSTINGSVYANYNMGSGAASEGTITINNSTINGSVYANYNMGSGSASGGTITISGTSTNLANASLYGSNNAANASNNQLIIDGWSGNVNTIANFQSITLNGADAAKPATITAAKADLSTLETINLNFTNTDAGTLEIAAGGRQNYLVFENAEINANVNITGAEGFSQEVVQTNANGVRVHRFGDVDAVDNNSTIEIGRSVEASILAGAYTDASGKTTDVSGAKTLRLDGNVNTQANILAGAYASDGNATGGKIIISGNYSAPADAKVYAGYSESGAVTDNSIELNASAANADLYGSNVVQTSNANNILQITAKDAAIKGAHNFDSIIITQNGSTLTASDSVSNIGKLDLSSMNYTYANVNAVPAGDLAENSAVTYGSVTVSDNILTAVGSNINYKTPNGGYIYADNGSNGLYINKIADAALKETKTSDSTTTLDISGTVDKTIAAGVFIDGSGVHTNSSSGSTLTLDANFSSANASVITGAYASNGNATGGKLIINGNYAAPADAKIYAGYSESGAVTDNTIELKASAANADLYGSNVVPTSNANNILQVTAKNAEINGAHNFDSIIITQNNSTLTASGSADNIGELDLISMSYAYDDVNAVPAGDLAESSAVTYGSVTVSDNILNAVGSNINYKTPNGGYIYADNGDNGLYINKISNADLSKNANGDSTTTLDISGTVDKTIAAGVFIDGSVVHTNSSSGSTLTLDANFSSANASIIAGAYASDGNATGGKLIISGNYTAAQNYGVYSARSVNDVTEETYNALNAANKIYAGYSESGAASGNSIELQQGANVENTVLLGSNTDGENNALIINGWQGTVQKLENFNVLELDNLNFDSEIEISSTEHSDLSDTVLKVNYSKDNAIRDKGTQSDILVLGNIKIGSIDGLENAGGDIVQEAADNNGVHVNKTSVAESYDEAASKTTITAKVDEHILTGKYVSDSQSVGSGTLTLGKGLTTTASIIAGSYASGSTAAEGGTLVIDGAYSAKSSANKLYAGYSESGAVTDNTIILGKDADTTQVNLFASNKEQESDANNKLVVNEGFQSDVKRIANFDTVELNGIALNGDQATLTITDGQAGDLSGTTITINSIAGGQELQIGDTINIIESTNAANDLEALGLDAENINAEKIYEGVTGIDKGEAVFNEKTHQLEIKITDATANPQLNLIAENRAVAAAFVNQGSDLIADGLASLAEQYDYGFKTFAAVYGNRSSYDVNDDLKINGWSDIVGFGSTHKTGAGDFDWGIFYENGTGNYRTYNNFNSEFFRGDGNLLYNGGGVAARLRRNDGFYYEASLRAGTLKSEMSNAVKDGAGNFYGYESDSTYYGAHVGVGKVLNLGSSKELDVYGKYFHTYVDGDSFAIDGDKFTFDSVKSDRVRIGAQLTTNKSNKWSAVYGLAYEYEFSGDSDMRAAQFDLPTQSLEGGTVIGKIGLKFKDAAASPWSLDLNLTGYQGQRDGFSGMVQATYNF